MKISCYLKGILVIPQFRYNSELVYIAGALRCGTEREKRWFTWIL